MRETPDSDATARVYRGRVTLAASQAIGVFDSGVGGLTVLDECLAALPAEDFTYFGDTAWFPYGDREPAQVRERALAIGRWLVGRGVKLIVVACNTATAVALAELQRQLETPVIGVIHPEVRAAVHATRNRRVGLLATEATARSGTYARMIRAQDAGVSLTTVACPGLAPVIQEGAAIDDAVVAMVADYTAPLTEAGVDTVILGCTHFPMVARLLRRALPGVTLIDGRSEIAREVVETLGRKGLRRPPGPEGLRRFACSGDPEAFRRLAARFLQMPLDGVELVDPAAGGPSGGPRRPADGS
ncbi:MAG: glutamate racemase [Thermoleophilia bacterium]|nr:glutamate racemase [Thermoleophilia bacterium]